MGIQGSKQVGLAPAFGILATAFLASMSVSSFFFIQPGDANANVGQCVSQAVISDSQENESEIIIDITLGANCPENIAFIYGVSGDNVSHEILTASPIKTEEGYRVSLSLILEKNLYTHYLISIEDAFSAKIETK